MHAARAGAPMLAPGKSVTVLDLGDPFVRLVITAPPGAPIDLSPLLQMKAGDSVRSIPTRLNLTGMAGAITRNADGSLSLGPPQPVESPKPGQVLQGGVLVFNDGRWAYHPDAGLGPAQPGTAQPPAQTIAQYGQATISRPGTTEEQARRHLAQCREYAEKSSATLAAAERPSFFNATMAICLRTFGYVINAPQPPG